MGGNFVSIFPKPKSGAFRVPEAASAVQTADSSIEDNFAKAPPYASHALARNNNVRARILYRALFRKERGREARGRPRERLPNRLRIFSFFVL